MPKRVKHPFLDEKSLWYWCLHCERVWLGEDWKANEWVCPNSECDGTALDAIAWKTSQARLANKSYPAIVVNEGGYYPVYGVDPKVGKYVGENRKRKLATLPRFEPVGTLQRAAKIEGDPLDIDEQLDEIIRRRAAGDIEGADRMIQEQIKARWGKEMPRLR